MSLPASPADATEDRVEALEIQLAWQGNLLEALNHTVAQLNREMAEHTRLIALLQQELRRQRDSASPSATAHEKPPHY